jgi:hypothetical protein
LFIASERLLALPVFRLRLAFRGCGQLRVRKGTSVFFAGVERDEALYVSEMFLPIVVETDLVRNGQLRRAWRMRGCEYSSGMPLVGKLLRQTGLGNKAVYEHSLSRMKGHVVMRRVYGALGRGGCT